MNIDPALRPESRSVNASTNNQSPTYQDRAGATESYTSTLLSTDRLYAESPLNDQQQHRQSYPPLTPQSTQARDPNSAARSETHGEHPDPKRPRACEACRGLKVKCEPDSDHPEGPCKRCTKANRTCVVTAPSRKRQKKADGRVAELEKKIDALQATLQASKPGGLSHDERDLADLPHNNDRETNSYEQVTNGGELPPRVVSEQTDWRHDMFPKVADKMQKSGPSPSMVAPPMVVAGQKRKFPEFSAPSPSGSLPPSHGGSGPRPNIPNPKGSENGPTSNDYADVIDRGIITAETASKMFDRYVGDMAPHIPAVVFPPGTTAAEIRKSKPTLFLAILSISSWDNRSELTREVMQTFADRIICNGEKSLELIQALLITSLWYWPPEHFEELKFYQLIHIAAVMAIDIGLGSRQKAKRHRIMAGLWRDNPWRRTPFPDPESVEARRTWLSCYFACCTASMGYRRPNLIRWTPFMSESIDFLYSSPDALPSDKLLCEWVKSQHIGENIGMQFSMDDPFATVQISDPKVQFALKGFERDLDHWASHVPEEVQRPTLKLSENVINLYMHEVALHVDHNVDEFQPPFTEEKLFGSNSKEGNLLSSAHISALSVCLTSIDGIFENFLSLEVDVIRNLPIFYFVRTAYAIIVLIKMYFSAARPNSELGKVIDKDHMKVEHYLDGLLEKFRAAAEDDRYRPASKFLMVLVMLKTWFQRQRDGKTSSGPAPKDTNKSETAATPTHDTGDNSAQPSQTQGDYVPNTPLQLLSEVATNAGPENKPQSYASNNNSNAPNNTAENSDGWQAQQPWNWSQNRFTNPHSIANPLNASQANLNSSGTATNWNGYEYGQAPTPGAMDLESAMGDGFEQALGITMGYGDFGKYFEDDYILGGFMDSIGGSGFGLGGG